VSCDRAPAAATAGGEDPTLIVGATTGRPAGLRLGLVVLDVVMERVQAPADACLDGADRQAEELGDLGV
jgi:hypothetical protein